MNRRNKLSRHLEAIRKRKGLSALELSTRIELGMNYVRNIERGLRLPSGDGLERLISALDLNPDEAAEVWRIADEITRPRAARDATAGLPIPGLVVWRHLPGLIYQVHGERKVNRYTDPDQALVDVVRSSASLLAWAAIVRDPIPPAHREELLRLMDRTKREALAVRPENDKRSFGMPIFNALPYVWREVLFSNRKSADELVKLLSEWRYSPGIWFERPDLVSFRFADPELDRRCAIYDIEPHEVVFLHDGLILGRLFSMLDVGDFGSPICIVQVQRTAVKKRFGELAGPDDSVVRREIEDDATPGLVKRREWQGLANYARFATRLFEDVFTASLVFGEAWKTVRDRVSARCDLVESLLKQYPPHAAHLLSRSYDQAGPAPAETPTRKPRRSTGQDKPA